MAALLGAATLTVALATAWPAHAGEQFYKGEVSNAAGKVDFVLKRKDGALRIKDFHANNLLETCVTGASSNQSFGFNGIKVKNRRFDHRRNLEFRGTHIAEVEGRLRRGGRASGTLRLFRGLDEMPICDTGTLEWKARN